jgi:hypothetical protein
LLNLVLACWIKPKAGLRLGLEACVRGLAEFAEEFAKIRWKKGKRSTRYAPAPRSSMSLTEKPGIYSRIEPRRQTAPRVGLGMDAANLRQFPPMAASIAPEGGEIIAISQ